MSEITLSQDEFKLIELDLNTGIGEATFETEEIGGYIEQIVISAPEKIGLTIEAPEHLGFPIYYNTSIAKDFFILRKIASDEQGNIFNYSHEKILCLGNLNVTIKGRAGVPVKIKIYCSY
jgi:hypothetical protein